MAVKKRANRNSSIDDYSAFLQTISLVGLGLETLNTEVHRVLLIQVDSDEAKISTDVNSSFEIAYEDDTSFIVAAGFQVVQTINNSTEEDKHFLDLSCLFTALFHCRPNASVEHRQRFRDNEVRMIFWPYLRNLISDISSRMSVPGILLPLIVATSLPPTGQKQN